MPVDDLVSIIPRLMEQAHVPGLAVALVQATTIRWSRGFGIEHAAAANDVQADTVFQAASLGKPVFAYAVLKLAERGEIDLDAPLTAYLPNPYVPDDPLLDQITARRVLCHTTGWPNWRIEGQPLRRDRRPGERFGYSGEGYAYLQRVIEHLASQPLEEFMHSTVFASLGMARSTYVWATPADAAVAASHDRAGMPSERYIGTRAEAASSLHTTVTDFARFLVAMLTPGDGPCQLSAGSLREMLRPQVKLKHAVWWGLGWGLETTGHGHAFWHWGDNPGYKSFTIAVPGRQTGIVILSNGDGGLALWEPIVKRALGLDHPAFAWLASFYGVPNLAATKASD